MNIIEARKYVGRRVVYTPRFGPREYGVLTSVKADSDTTVWVRYEGKTRSTPTDPDDIEIAPAPDGETYPMLDETVPPPEFVELPPPAGYILAATPVGAEDDDYLEADWDGKVHPSYESAQAELDMANGPDGDHPNAYRIYELRLAGG